MTLFDPDGEVLSNMTTLRSLLAECGSDFEKSESPY